MTDQIQLLQIINTAITSKSCSPTAPSQTESEGDIQLPKSERLCPEKEDNCSSENQVLMKFITYTEYNFLLKYMASTYRYGPVYLLGKV